MSKYLAYYLSGDAANNISLPLIEPVTIFQPAVAGTQIIELSLVEPVTVFQPSVSFPNFIGLNLISITTIFQPTVFKTQQEIDLTLLEPVTIYQPQVSQARVIGLDLIQPVTHFNITGVDFGIILPFIEPVTIFQPFVSKEVSIRIGMYLGVTFTAYLNNVLDIDATPDNDDPLAVTGSLTLATDANSGDTTLTLTATTLTGTVEAGETLTVSGTEYLILASATAESNQITVSIFPGLDDEIVLGLIEPVTVYQPAVVGA